MVVHFVFCDFVGYLLCFYSLLNYENLVFIKILYIFSKTIAYFLKIQILEKL